MWNFNSGIVRKTKYKKSPRQQEKKDGNENNGDLKWF